MKRQRSRKNLKANINGIDIAYDDHGVGLPILFLHAFPLNRSMWEGQKVVFLNEARWRLVAPDWRGFGESEIGADVSPMELLADDVAALMNNLGMQTAILCGLSMGGYVAFAFLRKYPQRVAGLILADTKPEADTDDAKANRQKVAQIAEFQGTAAIADLQLPRLISDSTRRHHPEVEMRVRQMINAATPLGIVAASRGMALRTDSTDLLATISFPTLVLVGEQDGITPPSMTQNYAARIPGAQFVVIPNAGHLSNIEQPQIFHDTVASFLRLSF
jgi:pimeloyl-ACP methyl ester carboxylesterase